MPSCRSELVVSAQSVNLVRALQHVTIWVTMTPVIRRFTHKGLERFYRTGSKAGIQAKHADRLRLILSNLDQAASAEHMDLPGLALHRLKGERKGIWAVKVSGNWRVTFCFADGDADIVHYDDYH